MPTNSTHTLRTEPSLTPLRNTPDQVLLSFTNAIAAVKDKAGLKAVIKYFFRQHFLINEYIITTPNEDGRTYSYFLHDLPAKDPQDPGFKIITGTAMPIEGSLTGAVLQAQEPQTFRVRDIVAKHGFSFPSASFWTAASADSIMGIRLRTGAEDAGILWIQPGYSNQRLLTGLCSQLAIAISNIRSHEKIQEQLKQINAYKLRLEEENLYLQEQLEVLLLVFKDEMFDQGAP